MVGGARISPYGSRASVGVRSGVTMAIEPAAHLHVRQCVSTGQPSSVWKNDSPTSSRPKPARRASATRTKRERRVRNDIQFHEDRRALGAGQAESASGRYTGFDGSRAPHPAASPRSDPRNAGGLRAPAGRESRPTRRPRVPPEVADPLQRVHGEPVGLARRGDGAEPARSGRGGFFF